MNSSRQSPIRQQDIAKQISTCDSYAMFNLLTSDELFEKLEQLLPEHRERLYTPTETLSMFLSQVLHPDRSCQRIVNEIAVTRVSAGMKPLSTRTGGYCRARQRLPLALPQELTRYSAQLMMSRSSAAWLWQGRNVKIVDGTTISMPDTAGNQRAYAQSVCQKPGIGFPICRLVGLMSLSCGAVIDVAYGPYQGKHTGETALFRTLLHNLQRDDVLLGDAFYGSYFLLCELQKRGADGVFKQHGGRGKVTDFRCGQSLGRRDHIVELKKPVRPAWMSEHDYANVPQSLKVRELRTEGKAAKTLLTTLLDNKAYSKKKLKQLYRDRWQVELNFRHIKSTLGLDVLRCKSPQMVEKEIWVTLLAYNLVRLLMAQAALLYQRDCAQFSFKHTVQLWLSWTVRDRTLDHATLFILMAEKTVANRPGRMEPRASKRRPKPYPKLLETRAIAREKIINYGHPPKVK